MLPTRAFQEFQPMPECIWSEHVIGIQFRPLRFSKTKRRILLQSAGHASIEALNAIAQYQHLAKVIGLFKDESEVLSLLASSLALPTEVAAASGRSHGRLSELGVESKAYLLVTLADPNTKLHSKRGPWIRNIFVSASGEQLTLLRIFLDSHYITRECLNACSIVHFAVEDVPLRDEIIMHIATHNVVAQRLGNQPLSVDQPTATNATLLKILSDIDDTMRCSGALLRSGVDVRYQRKTVYPGYCQFLRELDLTTDELVAHEQQSLHCSTRDPFEAIEERDLAGALYEPPLPLWGNLVFLTARFKSAILPDLIPSFKAEYQDTLHAMPTFLFGKFRDAADLAFQGDSDPIKWKKIENFERYRRLYPEYGFVFLGDNGQADAEVANHIRAMYPHLVKAAFIHVVQPAAHDTIEEAAKNRVYFVETYIDAAIAAHKIQLLTAAGVYRVAYESRVEFDRVRFSDADSRLKCAHLFDTALGVVNSMVASGEINAPPIPSFLGSSPELASSTSPLAMSSPALEAAATSPTSLIASAPAALAVSNGSSESCSS